MPNDDLESRLTRILTDHNARADTGTVDFALASPGRDWRWHWSPADCASQFFIASITKLYVTALLMQLRSETLIDLDAPAATYLGASVMAGIHVYKGINAGDRITVRELMSHTSGIADYFEQRRRDGSSQLLDFLEQDFGWTLDDVLRIAKREMSPRFPPSSGNKAFYSDTNYQLLGAVIEAVTGASYESALQQRILDPLGLTGTYPFTVGTIDRYTSVAPLLYGKAPVTIPKAMASVRADGGIVSTAEDGIAFLQAFIQGELFPKAYVDELQQRWRRIFFPLEYGVGVMRFKLPRFLTLFQSVPAMIGHSGASGAVLFYVPDLDLYVSGTVNQIKHRSLVYQLATRLVLACKSAW